MRRHHTVVMTVVLLWSILFGCGGGDSHSNSAGTGGEGGMGMMSVSLTDAPVYDWKAIYVTIATISVCAEPAVSDGGEDGCNWKVIAAPGETYNLLELVNGVTETLGETELPAGTYRQLRLMLKTELDENDEGAAGFNILGETHRYANYAIDLNDETVPLKVPESLEGGILLQKAFQIEERTYTELLLDFDAGRSMVMTAKGDAYRMRPVIRVVDMKQAVRVSGTVSMMHQASEELSIEPAVISAQYLDESAGRVLEAATATDDAGGYQLLLEKNKTYAIVVFSNRYVPACDFITTFSEEDGLQNDITRNFILDAAEVRPLKTQITGVTEGSEIDVSVRQIVQGCSNDDSGVEVIRKTLVADESGDLLFEATLPVNQTYTIVASARGKAASRSMAISPGEGYQETTLFLGE